MVAANMEHVNNRWKVVRLPIQFATKPLIFAQMVTENDSFPANVRIRNVSTTQFEIKVVEEEGADNLHGDETVAWFAIEPGSQTTNFPFVAGNVMANNNWKTVNLPTPLPATAGLITSVQSNNEMDPMVVRFRNPSTSSFDVFLQEEMSADVETSHINESLGYLHFKYW
ncbi:MAG: hypothetical protein R2769_14890 [Saprospiraceae bacterium]